MVSIGKTDARAMVHAIRQAAEAFVDCARVHNNDPSAVADYIDGIDDKITRYVRACCGEERLMIDVSGKRGISLGCGLVYQAPDIIHVDCRETPVTDVVIDLNLYPWPLPSSWCEIVVAHDIIEHLNDRISAINEIWRLLKPEGMAYIRMPNYAHAQAYRALDHQCYAAIDSLDLWVKGTVYNTGYGYYTACRFDKLKAEYFGAEIVWELAKAPTDDGRWELP